MNDTPSHVTEHATFTHDVTDEARRRSSYKGFLRQTRRVVGGGVVLPLLRECRCFFFFNLRALSREVERQKEGRKITLSFFPERICNIKWKQSILNVDCCRL